MVAVNKIPALELVFERAVQKGEFYEAVKSALKRASMVAVENGKELAGVGLANQMLEQWHLSRVDLAPTPQWTVSRYTRDLLFVFPGTIEFDEDGKARVPCLSRDRNDWKIEGRCLDGFFWRDAQIVYIP